MILDMYFDLRVPFLDYARPGQATLMDGNFLFDLHSNNFTDEIAGTALIAGLLMIAFSRERFEDERTLQLRLEALLWSVYVNSVLIILAIIFCYNMLFLEVMVYNICSTLLIFIARFHWVMYADSKKAPGEGV